MATPPPIVALLALASCSSLVAQAAAAPAALPPRLRLEQAFLAGARLPERVEVNGRIVEVNELVREATAAGIPDEQLARNCLERVVLTVLKDQLERQKAWLDDAAYEQAYAAHAEPYDKTPFTVKVLATRFKGYPSLEAFQARWRVLESCTRTFPSDAFGNEALAAEAQRSHDLLAGSGLEVELWFHEARAGDHGQRDFAAALAQAEATRKALVAAGQGTTELPGTVAYDRPGAKQPILLNQLREKLRESEFTTLLREGVAEALFRAAPGELSAPLRGAEGVYVARVVRKVEGKGTVDPARKGTRELLQQLLVQHRFREWIDKTFESSVVRMPAPQSPAVGK